MSMWNHRRTEPNAAIVYLFIYFLICLDFCIVQLKEAQNLSGFLIKIKTRCVRMEKWHCGRDCGAEYKAAYKLLRIVEEFQNVLN